MLPFNGLCSQGVWTNQLVLGFQYVMVKKSEGKFGFQDKSRILPNPVFFDRSSSHKKYIQFLSCCPVDKQNVRMLNDTMVLYHLIVIQINHAQASSFFLSPTNSTEIESIIMSLSSNKACVPFSISASLLKTLKGVLSIPLQLLFNRSFSTGLVPDQFKVVRVVPIHKKRVQFFSLQLQTYFLTLHI